MAKAGELKIEVSFDLDVNNVLNINAVQLETEVERDKSVEKVVPMEQPLSEKYKFWKEPPTKTVKVNEKYKDKIPGKKLDKFNVKSPYISLESDIKKKIKNMLSTV